MVAGSDSHAARMAVRAGVLEPLRRMLQDGSSADALWSARLLVTLSHDSSCLQEMTGAAGLLPILSEVLSRRTSNSSNSSSTKGMDAPAPSAARMMLMAGEVGRPVGGPGSSSQHNSRDDSSSSNSSSRRHEKEIWVEEEEEDRGNTISNDQDGTASAVATAELHRAQAHIAWLVAALAEDRSTRCVSRTLALSPSLTLTHTVHYHHHTPL